MNINDLIKCSTCRKNKTPEHFGSAETRVYKTCVECRSTPKRDDAKYMREYRERFPEKTKDTRQRRAYMKQYKLQLKEKKQLLDAEDQEKADPLNARCRLCFLVLPNERFTGINGRMVKACLPCRQTRNKNNIKWMARQGGN